jgi:hypothetical protein
VGIKTDDPVGSLGVGSANQVYITSTNISAAGDANSDTGLFINYYGYNEGHTQFRDTWIANGKGTVILTADGSTGNVTANTGNLVIGTAGKGIDFSNQASPAAGMSSELLDRYEEGTFTATIADAASGGNEGSTVAATYTRIGRLCHFRIGYVNLDTTGLTSGNNFHITGFPFTVTGGNGHMTPAVASYLSTPSTIQGYVVSGTTYALVVAQASTGAWPYVKVSGFTSGSADLYMNGSFEVAT